MNTYEIINYLHILKDQLYNPRSRDIIVQVCARLKAQDERIDELFDEIIARDKIIAEYDDKIERGELVEVVRCKDCKYFKESEITNRCFCTYHDDDVEMFKNDYCSYGERRADNERD